MDHLAGYAIAKDMVFRGPEDQPFRKSVDIYTIFGHWMFTCEQIAGPGNLDFYPSLAGEIRQKTTLKFLILDLPGQIAWSSKFYSL